MERRTIAGRYELVEPVGSAWRAVDTELGREVLVRLLAPDEPSPESAAATLAHPNIARVFDQGEADGERYVVVEYLPGGSLEERLPDLGEREAEAVAADVAAALAYAHSQGVAHGSLSAARVLFDGEGRAKVTGFGGGGEPADDVRALGGILESLAAAAPALAPLAEAAVAGRLDSAELLERLGDSQPVAAAREETTLILPSPLAEPSRRGVLAAAAVIALLAAGVGAAFLATTRDSNTDEPGLSIPAPPGTGETTGEETEAPPSTETEETTTEPTTTATTETQPTTTEPATTEPPLPPVPTEPLPTEPSVPTTTELPPPPTEETPTDPLPLP